MSMQPMFQRALMRIMQIESQNKKALEDLAVDLVKKEMGIPEEDLQFDPQLKKTRLGLLKSFKNFSFLKKKIEDIKVIKFFKNKKIDVIINLAAQAGHCLLLRMALLSSDGLESLT